MIATVVGNFPKVGDSREEQKWRQGMEAIQQKKISSSEWEEIQKKITREVIEIQIAAGISLITDGQVRWVDPLIWPVRKLAGISQNGLIRFFDNNVYYRQPVIEKAVRWEEPILVSDFLFAKQAAGTRAEVKAVLPGPYTSARLSKNNHYSKWEELVLDYAKALAQEAKALESAGAGFIQWDEPALSFHPEEISLAVKALEVCVKSLTKAKIALYTYFGGIEKIFKSLMNFPVHVLGIDLVSHSGSVQALRDIPSSRELALGILDARNTGMEKEEELRKLLSLFPKNAEKIKYINPSCGLEFLPREVAVKKLQLLGGLAKKPVPFAEPTSSYRGGA